MTESVGVPAKDTKESVSYSDQLIFWLNGERIAITNPDPTVMLTDYLHEIGKVGTKVGCGQGGCGACTVMISSLDSKTGKPEHKAVNACLRPLCAVDGMMVTTTEGIGSAQAGLDPAQFCIAANNGSQCGFCTPGFVMNTHAFLQNNPNPTQQQIEDIYGGNLCRCTGYRPILHGARTLACDYDEKSDCSQKCMIDPSFEIKQKEALTKVDLSHLPAHDRPARLLHFTGSGRHWYRPNTLAEVQRLKKEFVGKSSRPDVKLVFGNTASGIYQSEKPLYLIDISAIAELSNIVETNDGIELGASVTIQHLIDFTNAVIAKRPEGETIGLKELARHAILIAGYQVRSAGSVAGNIFITRDHAKRGGPFPSDLFTVLAALGTKMTIASSEYEGGKKSFELTQMPPSEEWPADAVILSFHIPFSRQREYIQTYRIARRMQMAHPIINAGMRVRFNDKSEVEEIAIIFAGLATMTNNVKKTEDFLKGKKWNKDTLKSAMKELTKEVDSVIVPMDEEGFTNSYRKQLALNFFYKFFLHVALATDPKSVPAELVSAANHHVRPLSQGIQEHTEYPEMFPLTQPYIKRLAFAQATGEIKYTQDIPLPVDGLHAAMVKSSHAHAKFEFTKNVPGLAKLKELLKKEYPGFKDLITVEDVPGQNMIGMADDDPVFCDGLVTAVGAPIGLAVADTIATARRAAEFIEKECIAYTPLPAILTLEEAIKKDTSMPMIRKAENPDEDIEQRLPKVTRPGSDIDWLENPKKKLPGTEQLEGGIHTGPQAHFYLETMCAMAIPKTYDEMFIYNSTQNLAGGQAAAAKALGVKSSQITMAVEQIGGGFGGKQHRADIVGAQAAVAARKLNRPVRLLFDRATDTIMIGKRHPYFGDYRIAYTPEGVIKALYIDMKSEAGNTYDCTFAVLDLSLLQADGCYNVETLRAEGTPYKTNKSSNTAFRTFGTVQSCAIFEDAIEHVAHELSQKGKKILPEEIRYKNMYRNGSYDEYDSTHFGQELKFCNIREIWDSLYESSEFAARVKNVEEFNKKNKWRKRGISMMPLKYGIAFTEPRGSLNSSNALINVNMADGSVLVQHGAIEMGQGVATKIAQVAANALGIPLEFIRVGGNSTDTISNAPPTAASTGYDLNGGAVELACRVLRTRLENFCKDLEQFTPHERIENWRTEWSNKWQEIVFKAWFNRINLSSAELYKSPHYKGPRPDNPIGKPFLYFSYSASVTEVEVDVLTGEFEIVRADLLCDVCKSPNPAIDIGQAEGGYVQGVGFVTTEELIFNEEGTLVTDNIWSYKPPCTKTIPVDFRVKLHPVDQKRNDAEELAEKHAVKSSKAFGEPSLALGLTAFFAIKHAIMDARKELTGKDQWLAIDIPATCQNIQQNCGVTEDSLSL